MNLLFALVLAIPLSFSCDNSEDPSPENINEMTTPEMLPDTGEKAAITAVNVSGDEGAYTFNVTIKSPDTGCEQYADWWEVVSTDGKLLYRRILAHSHVNEQPFARSGGPVNSKADDIVYIRAHMNTSGYGTVVYKGSVATGFSADTLEATFAQDIATEAPLPSGCAF